MLFDVKQKILMTVKQRNNRIAIRMDTIFHSDFLFVVSSDFKTVVIIHA